MMEFGFSILVSQYSNTQSISYTKRWATVKDCPYQDTKSNIQLFKIKYSNTQIFKSSNPQILKYSNTQIFKSSNIQILKYSNIQDQILKSSTIKYSNIQNQILKSSTIKSSIKSNPQIQQYMILAIIKKILIAPIRLYQWTLSPMLGKSKCNHQPTCSHYMIEAIEVWGPIRGLWMGLKRIWRCNPWWWGTWGYDPVPKRESKK